MMSNPPLKSERAKCYSARDAHFKCLEDNNDDIYKCTSTLEIFERDCPKSWIKHFEKTRDRLLLEGLKRRAMPVGKS